MTLAIVLLWIATTTGQAAELVAAEQAAAKVSLGFSGAAQGQGQDWPAFLGPGGDGKSTETGFEFDWTRHPPQLLWSRPLGESYGIGTVCDGAYYQFDYRGGDAELICLDAKTGKERWRFAYRSTYRDLYNYNPGPRTSPVVDDGHVYLYGVDGQLICVDAATGRRKWQVDTVARFGVIQNFFGVGSTPVVHHDLLLVMVGGSPAADQAVPPGQLDRVSGNGSAIVAFDKRSGEVVYQCSSELASYAGIRVVHRDDRDWAFAYLRGGLLAFDPFTGQEEFFFPWRARTLESVNASTPVVWDNYVFISETYGPGAALLRFGAKHHDVVWQDDPRRRDKAMQTHWNTSIYHDGHLYGSSGRHTQNAELRCIAALTGDVKWSQPGLTRCSLLYVDGHLICLGEYGDLRVLRANPERYEQVAQLEPVDPQHPDTPLLKYPAWAAPIVSHGLLYVRGRDRVACYELPKSAR